MTEPASVKYWGKMLGELSEWGTSSKSGFLVLDESIYFACDNIFYRLNKQGEVTGQTILKDYIGYTARPAYGNGLVVVPLDGGALEAIDPGTMKTVWTSDGPGDFTATVTDDQGQTTSATFALQNGSSLYIDNGHCYSLTLAMDENYMSIGGYIHAVDMTTGDTVWVEEDRAPDNGPAGYNMSGPVVIENWLLMIGEKGELVVRDALTGFFDHAALTLAASIAYYTALSLAPLLILGLWLSASISPTAQAELVNQVDALVGPAAGDAIKLVIDNAASRPSFGSTAGVISLLLMVFSASAVFSQLQTALNVIWGVQELGDPKPSLFLRLWLRRRLLAIGIIAAFVFVFVVSLVMNTTLVLLLPQSDSIWMVVNEGIGLVVFTILFAALFRYLPDQRTAWRNIGLGALVTAALFSVGKYVIGMYLARSPLAGAYGPAGSMALLLVWVFYSAVIFLFGAELIGAFAKRRGERSVTTTTE